MDLYLVIDCPNSVEQAVGFLLLFRLGEFISVSNLYLFFQTLSISKFIFSEFEKPNLEKISEIL